MAASRPTNIDYAATYFQISKLTPIHGEPDFSSLRVLRDELKANAGSVTTTLGGGHLGYLGLLLSPEDYNRVAPATPFARPPNPGPLVIPIGTTQHAATRMKEDHTEELRIFRECIDVEQALIKQVLEAIQDRYTKCLRNRLTQRVDMTVEELLLTLFQRYGFVTQHQLAEFESSIRQYTYNVQDPLSLVFDQIEELQLLAEASRTPYSDGQLVSFGVEILRNTQDFQDGIKSWNRLPLANRTWQHFITHFEQEYQELLELRGPTMQNSSLHSANTIVAQVTASVQQSVESSVAKALSRHSANTLLHDANSRATSHVPNLPLALQNLPPGFTVQEIHPTNTNPSVAFSSFTPTGSEMDTMFKVFMDRVDERMKKQEQALSEITKQNKNNPNGGGGSGYRKRKNITKYCWSHGACAHSSADCNNKKSGHKDEATFANKMEGSTRFCGQK